MTQLLGLYFQMCDFGRISISPFDVFSQWMELSIRGYGMSKLLELRKISRGICSRTLLNIKALTKTVP